jgi:hypothetical protein
LGCRRMILFGNTIASLLVQSGCSVLIRNFSLTVLATNA